MQPPEPSLTVTYNGYMMTELRAADLDWLVNFVNEYGTEPRRVAGEQHEAYAPLDELGEHDRALTAGVDKTQLVALADRLYKFFTLSHAEAAETVNELLAESDPSPRAHTNNDVRESFWVVEYRISDPITVPAMAVCALALLEILVAPYPYGICNAARCVDAFVDRSPGGQRRYCSALCQNRAKVAAFRERRAARET